MNRQLVFEDDFDAAELNRDTWLPNYLPAWSSTDATAATYAIADSCLTLSIPARHPLWMQGDHSPLRVSGIQSGNWSGPVGSSRGQQPIDAHSVVREQQQEFWGWTPEFGRLELRARMSIGPGSMAAWWMVGRELIPEESAEICIVEVFGDRPRNLGSGLHPFRDRRIREDFAAPFIDIDVSEFHTYAVDWTRERVEFSVDDRRFATKRNPPTYPMQHMIAVFDFPDERRPDEKPHHEPSLAIDWIRGYE